MTTERRHDLFAVALLVLLPTIFFWDVLTGVNGLYIGDLSRVHYPMSRVLHDVVQRGELPFWNRLLSGGQPLAANPESAVFYPPHWLVLLPSFDFGFRLHVMLHIYLALIGMYALLRTMGLRIAAATFGAISFGLGGLLLSLVHLLPLLYSASWLPLTCLFTRRFLLRPNPCDFALASIALAMQCLAGDPVILGQTLIVLVVYAAYRAARRLAWIAAIAVSGGLAAAVQVIPGIDWMRDVVCNARTTAMPAARLAELVFPNLLGHVSINGLPWYWAARLYPHTGMPLVFNVYCGLAVAALSVAGFVRRVRGTALTATLVVVSVLLALTMSEAFMFLGGFALIVFSARVLDAVLDGDPRLIEAAAGFTIATGVIAVAIFTLRGSVSLFLDGFGLEPSGGAMLMAAQASSDWLTAAGRALALLILLLTIRHARPAVWMFVALIFVCFDLAFVVNELNPRMPREFFERRPPLAEALLTSGSAGRVFHQAAWTANSATGLSFFAAGPQSYWVARNGLFPPINAGYGIASVMEPDDGRAVLRATAQFRDALLGVVRSGQPDGPLMAMSNASYRAIYNGYDEEQRAAGGDFTKLVPVALQEEQQQPRYYFADQIRTVSGVNDFLNAIATQPLSRNIALVNVPSFQPARGVVNRVQETASDAAIDVTADGRSFLVMSVTPHKYWIVRIDRTLVTPIATNIGYQGIIVPAGRHRIVMRYRNTLIPPAAVISLMTLAALCAAALRWRNA